MQFSTTTIDETPHTERILANCRNGESAESAERDLSADFPKETTMSTTSFPAFVAKTKQIAIQSLIGLALLIAGVMCALAQDAHSQMPALHQELTTEQKSQASALLKIVRGSTERSSRGELDCTHTDFLLFADAWDKKNQGPPELMGQLFHYLESPNRLGLPAFYTLHVWAWKDSPNGAFDNWHPNVSCQQFGGQAR
jgi:hypothetical protein